MATNYMREATMCIERSLAKRFPLTEGWQPLPPTTEMMGAVMVVWSNGESEDHLQVGRLSEGIR